MALNIVFGWHLDGLTYPECPSGRDYELGGLVVGPAGLVQQLSMRLGLGAPLVPQAVRIAHYMQALRAADTGDRFYSTSFAIDAWSTASCLLVMRDQLISAGWDGQPLRASNAKLRALSDAEQHSEPLGSPAEATRRLLENLRAKSSQRLPFRSLHLATPIGMLPPSWRTLMSLLGDKGITLSEIRPPLSENPDSDLSKLQAYLANGSRSQLTGDGSFCLLEADDEFQLAEVTSAWLSSQIASGSDLVLLRDAPTTILDSQCVRRSLPRIGGNDKSPWRSALQILPLTLQTSWRPANPYRLLELIALPDGPVPRHLSHHFVQALRVEPGFGGQRWASAWQAVESDLKDFATKRAESGESDGNVDSLLAELRAWIEPPRFDPHDGIPVDHAVSECRRVFRWASARYRKEGASEIFLQVVSTAQELEDTLKASGLVTINKIQLDRMLDAVTGEGCRPERWHAQAADWFLIDHPGQLWNSVDSVCWWGFTLKSAAETHFDPWTTEERNALNESGITIEQPEMAMVREAHAWRHALLNTKQNLLLCRPRIEGGAPSSRHALWDELEELAVTSSRTVVHQAHQILSRTHSRLCGRDLVANPLEPTALPRAYRHWLARDDRLTPRLQESASSCIELLGCPMSWVLRYHAQMHPSILLALPDGDELIGDIAHELFQHLFQQGPPANDIASRAGRLFDDLVERVGLPLMLDGRQGERLRAKRLLVSAAEHFAGLLSTAGLTVCATEAHRTRSFGNGEFVGDIDILLSDQKGNQIVVDYKWTKSIKYRIEELEKARHLQLAAYAWLESTDRAQVDHVGYYMLRQRRLIHAGVLNLNIGQQISTVPPREVWDRAEALYDSTMTALRAGSICAAGVDDAEPAPVEAPWLEPPCKFCRYPNICGRGKQND